MALTSTSSNSANLHSYYVKKALAVLERRLQLVKLGKKTKLPKGTGVQAKWLQYTTVAGSTSTLTEGTNPSEISLTTANVTATVLQYGQFCKITDLFQMSAIDNVIESASERFGYAAQKSLEALCVAELDSALTARFANGAANAAALTSSDVITMKEFIKASIALKAALVGPHESGKYVAVLHPHAEYDLLAEENAHGWLAIREQASRNESNVMEGEIGSAFGCRFVVSDSMSAANEGVGSASVKVNYLIGEECFGVVDITSSKEGFEMIIKPHDSGGQANPLNMYGTVGYKIGGFVAKNFAAGRGRSIKAQTSFA